MLHISSISRHMWSSWCTTIERDKWFTHSQLLDMHVNSFEFLDQWHTIRRSSLTSLYLQHEIESNALLAHAMQLQVQNVSPQIFSFFKQNKWNFIFKPWNMIRTVIPIEFHELINVHGYCPIWITASSRVLHLQQKVLWGLLTFSNSSLKKI